MHTAARTLRSARPSRQHRHRLALLALLLAGTVLLLAGCASTRPPPARSSSTSTAAAAGSGALAPPGASEVAATLSPNQPSAGSSGTQGSTGLIVSLFMDGSSQAETRWPRARCGGHRDHAHRSPGQDRGNARFPNRRVVGERAQERADRRRRPDPAEQPRHAAVPQHARVVDAVRAGHHPATTPADLTAAFAKSTLRCSPSRSYRPAVSRSSKAGVKPAQPSDGRSVRFELDASSCMKSEAISPQQARPAG